MIVPIRCMSCGTIIADKWRYFQRRVKELSAGKKSGPVFMDGTTIPNTPERQVLDELGLRRICCRTHFLTQRDLMVKL